MLRLVPASVMAMLLTGCPGFGDRTRGEECDVGEVNFEAHVNPILQQTCSGGACHNNFLPPLFVDNFEVAKESAARIRARGIGEKSMPPASSGKPILTDDQACVVIAWIDSDTPQGTAAEPGGDAAPPPADAGPEPVDQGPSADAGGAEPCDPGAVTFQSNVSRILEQRCSGGACHNNFIPPLFVGNFAVASGSAARIKVRGIDQKTMPPGTSGLPALTDAEACVITTWIDNGLPEN